jgi:hypothetical protein
MKIGYAVEYTPMAHPWFAASIKRGTYSGRRVVTLDILFLTRRFLLDLG